MADTWRADPPSTPHRFDWNAIKARLIRRPDEWLLIEKGGSRSIAGAVRTGRIAALRDPAWDFKVRVRETKGNKGDLWMSATPREEEHATAASDD